MTPREIVQRILAQIVQETPTPPENEVQQLRAVRLFVVVSILQMWVDADREHANLAGYRPLDSARALDNVVHNRSQVAPPQTQKVIRNFTEKRPEIAKMAQRTVEWLVGVCETSKEPFDLLEDAYQDKLN